MLKKKSSYYFNVEPTYFYQVSDQFILLLTHGNNIIQIHHRQYYPLNIYY